MQVRSGHPSPLTPTTAQAAAGVCSTRAGGIDVTPSGSPNDYLKKRLEEIRKK